ncbi:MAG: hypothetical protein V1787_00065 [Candidatus Micrarchaeota archaeon]
MPKEARKEQPEKKAEEKGKAQGVRPQYLAAGGVALILVVFVSWLVFFNQVPPGPLPGPTPQAKLTTIYVISAPTCTECFDAAQLAAVLQTKSGEPSEIVSLRLESAEAERILAAQNITFLPTVVLETDESKAEAVGARINDVMAYQGKGVFVLAKPYPVYVDLATGKEVGRIEVTYLDDPDCIKCTSLRNFTAQLEQLGVRLGKKTAMDYNTTLGRQKVAQYNITKVPSLVFSSDISAYPSMLNALGALGKPAADGSFVFTEPIPPYRDLTNGNIVGYVSFIYISYEECHDCYNPDMHKPILERRYGMNPISEGLYDYNSTTGMELVLKYNITSLPTIMISPEAMYYPDFSNQWKSLGTEEADGWFVFRAFDRFPAVNYFNLTSGMLVLAEESANGTGGQVISIPVGQLAQGAEIGISASPPADANGTE